MDPTMSEATKHAILTLAELDDWEAVEGLLDPITAEYWSRPEVRDKVVDGVLRDLEPPVVEPSAFWPAVIVVVSGLLYLTTIAVVSLWRGV